MDFGDEQDQQVTIFINEWKIFFRVVFNVLNAASFILGLFQVGRQLRYISQTAATLNFSPHPRRMSALGLELLSTVALY